MRAPPVSAADRVLVDLGLTTGRLDTGETSGSALDHFLYLASVVDSTRAVACKVEPSTRHKSAVLTLITAIQDLCRGHGRAVEAAAASAAWPAPDLALGGSAWKGAARVAAAVRGRGAGADQRPVLRLGRVLQEPEAGRGHVQPFILREVYRQREDRRDGGPSKKLAVPSRR